MAAPQGVAAAAAPVRSAILITSPGAAAPDIHGGPADPAHGQYTWEDDGSLWLPWEIVPGGAMHHPVTAATDLVGDTPPAAPAGTDPQGWADPTWTHSHGAPWPHEHIPDAGNVSSAEAAAAQAQANRALHGTDSGDPAAFTSQPVPEVDSWQRMGYVTAGEGGLELPGRQMIGNGNTGFRRDSGWTAPGDNLNTAGMDSAHVSRYRRTGGIPVPPNSTQGSQRPLEIHPASARSYPVGAGSPFEGQVPGWGSDYSAGYTGLPSDYQPSPDPPTGPPLQTSQPGPPVWGYDLYG